MGISTLLQSVCLTSVAYIERNSRTERSRKTEIGTEVAHVACDLDTAFKVKRSKVNLLPTCRNRCHLANKYEDIVNSQGRRHIVAAYRLQLVVLAVLQKGSTRLDYYVREAQ